VALIGGLSSRLHIGALYESAIMSDLNCCTSSVHEEKTMNSRTRPSAIAFAVFAVLLTTLPLAAQELRQQNKAGHHRYQLVDLGTLGGPNGYLTA
jgi:hypothetical protein